MANFFGSINLYADLKENVGIKLLYYEEMCNSDEDISERSSCEMLGMNIPDTPKVIIYRGEKYVDRLIKRLTLLNGSVTKEQIRAIRSFYL